MECRKHYEIIYPYKKTITERTLRSWYDDAIARGEVGDVSLTNPDDMAFELNRMELITLKPREIDNGN